MTQAPEDAELETGTGGRSALARLAVPLGLVAGCAVYWALTRVFTVPVEVFTGPETFAEPAWLASVALVPLVSGFVAGLICGHYGKWYGMVPVVLIHPIDYYLLASTPHPDVRVLGAGLFVFFMIVMVELALMAGWGGEIVRARLAGRNVRA